MLNILKIYCLLPLIIVLSSVSCTDPNTEHNQKPESSETLFDQRVDTIVKFFDAFNCGNITMIFENTENPEIFQIQADSVPNLTWEGRDKIIEYLVNFNGQATAGGFSAAFLLPSNFVQNILIDEAPNKDVIFNFPLFISVTSNQKEIKILGDIRFYFSKGVALPNKLKVEFSDSAQESMYVHTITNPSSDIICKALYSTRLEYAAYLIKSKMHSWGSAYCKGYAESDETLTPQFQSCNGYLNPRTKKAILGGSFEACTEILKKIPFKCPNSTSYGLSASSNTLHCRNIHVISAAINPAMHCKHLDIPSLDIDKKTGHIVNGPCYTPCP
ncbi:hypothetical protein [Shewanella surugensis]|uniref:Lipoprotein n=1 Tax=Shewanella surugensis TaxID=212020 RepID=A0ABT0LJM1_9GAMM|nr:hypothetical protein [Shewanella surugensis]MCL1127918.1 hypothetical protein [Shewanella surugensis]